MDRTETLIEARPPAQVELTSFHDKDTSCVTRSPIAIQLSEPFALPGIDPGERSYGLEELQNRAHPEHSCATQALFRALGAEIRQKQDTASFLKIYPVHEAFGTTRQDVEQTLCIWLTRIGWRYQIFGPDEEGGGWTNPDFRKASYQTKTVWIYQPADPHGSFRDYAYTLAWR